MIPGRLIVADVEALKLAGDDSFGEQLALLFPRDHHIHLIMLRLAIARGVRASEQGLQRSARSQWQSQRLRQPLIVRSTIHCYPGNTRKHLLTPRFTTAHIRRREIT
jgi:hypothetical protein